MAKREIPEINAGSMADIAFLLLIFFLVTTTMDKDTAYIRQIPKILENPPPPVDLEKRNICSIAANNLNQLLFRGEPINDPDIISEKIVEFYRKNEDLNQAETRAAITNPNDERFNFPFYSFLSKEKLEEELEKANQAYDDADEQGLPDDIIDFKAKAIDEWMVKKKALKLYGKNILPEIHLQSHIRVEVMQQTQYELFAKIHSEIEEAIYELRNDAAEDIFGESYGIIKHRRAMDKEDEANDQPKLDLLNILYPARIIEVKPK